VVAASLTVDESVEETAKGEGETTKSGGMHLFILPVCVGAIGVDFDED
jgi:hypothetical protein